MAFYRPGQTFTYLGGPPSPFGSQIKLAAGVGVDFVSFPVDLPWPKPGEPVDWTGVESECQTVLDANPQALLLPRIGMEPPAWWREAHPDDVMVWDQGPQKHAGAVVASPDYRRDAAERLAALIAHLEEKFGDRTAGYHPCGQNTGEWFYQETWGPALNGYAPGDLRAWRRWLAERYPSDAALQAAWHEPQVTTACAEVPTPAARRAAPAGILHDPAGQPPADRLRRVPAADDGRLCVRAGAGGAAGFARTKTGGVLLRLRVRVRSDSQRPGHGGALRAAASPGLPRH